MSLFAALADEEEEEDEPSTPSSMKHNEKKHVVITNAPTTAEASKIPTGTAPLRGAKGRAEPSQRDHSKGCAEPCKAGMKVDSKEFDVGDEDVDFQLTAKQQKNRKKRKETKEEKRLRRLAAEELAKRCFFFDQCQNMRDQPWLYCDSCYKTNLGTCQICHKKETLLAGHQNNPSVHKNICPNCTSKPK
jgi:hypothetical protein